MEDCHGKLRYTLQTAMDFIECYLCGDLAVEEHVSRDLTITIFCTNKTCGRYDVDNSALQLLQAGYHLKQGEVEITSRVYDANRKGEQILVTPDDLQQQSESTP